MLVVVFMLGSVVGECGVLIVLGWVNFYNSTCAKVMLYDLVMLLGVLCLVVCGFGEFVYLLF